MPSSRSTSIYQGDGPSRTHAGVALAGNPLAGNDRQFDLWRSIAYDGQVEASS
ncbi:hypothetical protein ACSNN9_03985 [Micromonospora sp. URMC 107]|uniref:hypothetical protein n=1 Tax=Micromonospora sp. URMC 107 TaxID=3423418 RepID=UPI003F1A4DF2